MTVEIELKFIATPEAAAHLPGALGAWPHQHTPARLLSNTYYETAENTLRGYDMGLRIRGEDGRYEMTLKTKGQTVGGLHQRPEYNVPLAGPALDISLFPSGVWPAGCNTAELQQALRPLFSTHFQREKWVVTYRQSQIEVALDQGEVKAGELAEPLCEIELELKQGERDDLLAFAGVLSEDGGLRLGSLSKAARGYYLAQGRPAQAVRPVPVLRMAGKPSVEQGMQAAFMLGLNHWQYHEELWLRGESKARAAVGEAIALLRQVFTLFGGLVPRKASTDLRAGLTLLEERLAADDADARTLCFSAAYLQTQLALTRWLVLEEWRAFVDDKAQSKLSGSFKRFADIMLGRTGAELKEMFSHIHQGSEYQDKLTRLCHLLLTLHLLAGAYSGEGPQHYIGSWRDLAQAIADPEHASPESASHRALAQPAFWLNGSH
ncbi:CYTH domain-containing protein [Enterobacillus tribolii]|uniref:Triphosphatase n=1 Tax=Enterobacillus tribolii TaxID=1487935 RepID=A0A370R1E9_9GAMM|nr:inorganic triphosphatase [Enterobacillus tribolii]MBW7982686.1 inorganic triphosphatase [Enterobacillus tribolii]RDK95753.1 triphosphatase [Enterobacillus tribolii]